MIPTSPLAGGLHMLADAPRKQGLALRPPKHLLRLLHLAREYAAAVAFRPISFGNLNYLHERVRELHVLGTEIEALCPSLSTEWQSMAGSVAARLQECSGTDSQRAFAVIVEACDRTGYRRFWERQTTSIPAWRFPVLDGSYEHIIIATGPAIGLGDEIACASFVRHLRARWPDATMEVRGFYPGLWSSVDSSIAEHTVSGSPLQAFAPIETAVQDGTYATTLVVFINFTGLSFHCMYCMDRHKPDIVEIAVGRGMAWFVPGDNGPVQVLSELDPVYPNNYIALEALTEKLLGKSMERIVRSSRANTATPEDEYRIVINPLTSKPIILTPRDWAMLVGGALSALYAPRRIHCVILPGLATPSAEYARATAEEIRKLHLPYCSADVLNGGQPLQADTAFRQVHECIGAAQLLLGVDTSTAHLAPMLSVPSIALCYERNIAFWAPYDKAFWVELRHHVSFLRDLVTLVMHLTGASVTVDESLLRTARTLPSSLTEPDGPTEEMIALYSAAWNTLPVRLQKLLTGLDGSYTWPVMESRLYGLTLQPETRTWLYRLIRQLHFSKVLAMLNLYGRAI